MSKMMAFCMVGGHSVEVADVGVLPEGWKMVRASVIPDITTGPEDNWSPGIWYLDDESPASILSCPLHDVVKA